jgi:hypothetical protein
LVVEKVFWCTVAYNKLAHHNNGFHKVDTCERAFAIVVKCLSSTSQIPGSTPSGNKFPDWVKKISSPLHTGTHQSTG